MASGGTDWKAGAVFTVTTKLPAGTHDVRSRPATRSACHELGAGIV
jgi:hypothetical protein